RDHALDGAALVAGEGDEVTALMSRAGRGGSMRSWSEALTLRSRTPKPARVTEPAMIDQIGALRVFVRVARAGGFSRVAQELGLSQPTVSRTIADLEKSLGVTLFTRTTRAVTL